MMADPFGILGLVAVIGQILNASTLFARDWKNAPDDAKTFIAELRTLKTALSETHTNIVVNKNFQDAFTAFLRRYRAPRPAVTRSMRQAPRQRYRPAALRWRLSLRTLKSGLRLGTGGNA
jgi:hypothetical protein